MRDETLRLALHSRARSAPLRASALIALALAAGCSPDGAAAIRMSLGVQVGSRSVGASIDGPAFASQEGDAAVVRFAGHKITVEKERVLVDGKEIGTLPAAAEKVDVKVAGGQVTVSAGGASPITARLEPRG